MNEESFTNWSISDLLFESKLERTMADPERKLKIELEIKKREKQSEERYLERAILKEKKYKQFRTSYQLWGAVFLLAELFVYSFLALGSHDESPSLLLSLTLLSAGLVIVGCWIFCIFDTINRGRWGSFIGVGFAWVVIVPYYLIVTTRYD